MLKFEKKICRQNVNIEIHRLKVFENGVLRKVSGPKSDELRGEWRRLHDEELK